MGGPTEGVAVAVINRLPRDPLLVLASGLLVALALALPVQLVAVSGHAAVPRAAILGATPGADDSGAVEATPAAIRDVQRLLRKLGARVGQIDGIVGPLTRQAVADFQVRHHLPETDLIVHGRIPGPLMKALRDAVAAVEGQSNGSALAAPAEPPHAAEAHGAEGRGATAHGANPHRADQHGAGSHGAAGSAHAGAGHGAEGGHGDGHGGHAGHDEDEARAHETFAVVVALAEGIAHQIGESLEFFEIGAKIKEVFGPLKEGDTAGAVSTAAGVATEYGTAAQLVAAFEVVGLITGGTLLEALAGLGGIVLITRAAKFAGEKAAEFTRETFFPNAPAAAGHEKVVHR